MTPDALDAIEANLISTITNVSPWQGRTITAGLAATALARTNDAMTLLVEVRHLRAAVDAALALHKPCDWPDDAFCASCDRGYPCATVRAIAAAAAPTTTEEETP